MSAPPSVADLRTRLDGLATRDAVRLRRRLDGLRRRDNPKARAQLIEAIARAEGLVEYADPERRSLRADAPLFTD